MCVGMTLLAEKATIEGLDSSDAAMTCRVSFAEDRGLRSEDSAGRRPAVGRRAAENGMIPTR